MSRLVAPTGTKGCAGLLSRLEPPTGTKGPCPPLAWLGVGPGTKATYCPGPKGCRDKWPGTNACFIDVHVLYLHHGYASNNHGAHTAYGTIQVACIAGTKTIMFAVQKPLYRSIDRQMDVATTRLLNLYLVKLARLHAKYQPQATTDAT